MHYVDLEVVKALLLEEPEVFRYYFVDLSEQVHPDEAEREKAERVFRKYGHPLPFVCFVREYQQYCRDRQTTTEDAVQTVAPPPPTVSVRSVLETADWPIGEEGRRIQVVPPSRKRKRPREGFDATGFLLLRRQNREEHRLGFLADEEVQERLAAKKKTGWIDGGVLKKMSDLAELLNQSSGYRVLHVYPDALGSDRFGGDV